MTYRELIQKLMKQDSNILDQNIVIFNEEDERFYGITGHDVAEDNDVVNAFRIGTFFLMVNI